MPEARHIRPRGTVLTACAALIAGSTVALLPTVAEAASPDVVISQVYGGGGNANAVFTNDFVELFNRGASTVSLAGWSIQYASATGIGSFGANSGQLTPLSGSIPPGKYVLVQEAAGTTPVASLPTPDITDSTPINMSGSGGKVALVTSATGLGCNGSSTACSSTQLALVKDLVGWDGANFFEGTSPAPATANQTAALRLGGGCKDSDDNGADFTNPSPTPAPRNSGSPFHDCSSPAGVGTASPSTVFAGTSTTLAVAVIPGINPDSTGLSVTCDLTTIGGSATQALYDDGTNGDTAAGDNTFSYSITPGAGTGGEAKSLSCTVRDAQNRNGPAMISLTVHNILPIGTFNGAVSDTDNGATHLSPYAGQPVTVQGVIYEKTLQATNSTDTYKGFYLQNTASTDDDDPNTSDGLFVFMSKYDTLIGGYTPTVGDEVVLSGTISEYYNMTELTNASLSKPVVRSGVDINDEIAPVVADPPTNLANANRYWERLQGMRVRVPQNSLVLGGRNVFSPADAEIWVARPDSTVALRTDAYARRAFRDAHPLDDNYTETTWDGNGYRILMGSLGIKAGAGDAQALIAPARTFDTLTNSPAGGLNYTFSKYRIEIAEQPDLQEGVDPALNNPPEAFDRLGNYSIVDYNLENLYDYRDNPFSGCDFTGPGNDKCIATTPFMSDVKPPYDYVPASDTAYQVRLTDIAKQVINDLHAPDVLMLQEVENQDICSVVAGALTCGSTDNADGKPDVLQELALTVANLGGPSYDAAFDRDSSDLRGIAPAFLYRTDRVQLLPATGDPILSTSPAIDGYTAVPYDADVSNPKSFNAVLPTGVTACETNWVFPRAPDVALFRIWSASVGVGTSTDVYAIDNHFKSGPDTCVTHRTEQAKYNAALVTYLQAQKPDARIVVGGDLNVYPEPDDPFAPIGQTGSSDQLKSLYDAGLTNLWNVLLAQAPEAAYSYVYLGQAQTLDQMFVNGPLLASLGKFRVAHINSDFPADYPGDVARGTSDHDPNVALFRTAWPWTGPYAPLKATTNTVQAGASVPVKFSLGGNQGLDIFAAGYPLSQDPSGSVAATASGASGLQYDTTTGQYVFSWKTDKAWVGTTRVLILRFIDGTTQRITFKFAK